MGNLPSLDKLSFNILDQNICSRRKPRAIRTVESKTEPSADPNNQCPVCLEEYNIENRERVVLDCRHRICRPCVRRMKESKLISCPLCRTEISHLIIQECSRERIPVKNSIRNDIITPYNPFPNPYQYDFFFKFLIFGQPKTGKTSLAIRFSDNVWLHNTESRFVGEVRHKIESVDGVRIKVQVWDNVSDWAVSNIQKKTSLLMKNCLGVIICFDLTKQESFNGLNEWLSCLKFTNLGKRIIIVGTKADLTAQRAISYKEAKSWCDKQGLFYIETSAKEDSNVREVFMTLLEQIMPSALEETYKEEKCPVQELDLGKKWYEIW